MKGMMDMMGMMKQVQAMQAKIQDLQAEFERIEVEGSSGGGLVKTLMSAKGELKRIDIDDSLLKVEEKEILEDLIMAALNDGRTRGERLMQERTSELTAGLPIPPGMKLPF